jgi:hypothetical protein
MFIFINKKGNSLLEVIISIALLAIITLACATTEIVKIRFMTENKQKEKYILCLEAIKMSIINDISCEKIVELSTINKKYIAEDNIEVEVIAKSDVSNLFSNNIEKGKTFIEMNTTYNDESSLFYIELKCHLVNRGINKDIECSFYKGDYH